MPKTASRGGYLGWRTVGAEPERPGEGEVVVWMLIVLLDQSRDVDGLERTITRLRGLSGRQG